MTALKYLLASKVATSAEIIAFKQSDPDGFRGLVKMAEEEMRHNGIEVEEPPQK